MDNAMPSRRTRTSSAAPSQADTGLKRYTPSSALLLVVALLLPVVLPQHGHGSGMNQVPTLGRLFTTPNQRAQLDRARRMAQIKQQYQAQGGGMQEMQQQAFKPSITVQGMVTRSRGPNAFWINEAKTVRDDPLPEGAHLPEGLDPTQQPYVLVTLPKSHEEMVVKPGQTLNGLTGRVLENYEVRQSWLEDPEKQGEQQVGAPLRQRGRRIAGYDG